MANLQPVSQRDFSAGMISNINPKLKPQNSCKVVMNCDCDDELGSLVSRLGTGIVGTQLVDGKTVLGLHDFRDTDGSNHALIAFVNNAGNTQSVGYKVGTGTITGLTTQTASLKHRMLTFLDSVLIVNGTDSEKSYDGATVITTGGAFDLANIPVNPHFIAEFLDRVYVARNGDDTLYYSSIPTAGAVSWTSGNGSVEIEPEDGGGGLKGFGKVPGYLLIFKERSMKRWNFVSAFPESLVNIGTPSQESVINAHGLCAFFSATDETSKGFYVTAGDRPVPISHDRIRSIRKWVDAISASNYDDIAGWATDSHFAWSVGDLTVDGVTYSNVVLRWNRVLDQWTARSYPSQFSFFTRYVNGSSEAVIVGGDDDGTIIQLDKSGTYTDYDSGTATSIPIHWEARLQDEDFGFNQMKELENGVILDGENFESSRLQVFLDDDGQKNLGGIKGRTGKVSLTEPLKATHYGFSIKGTNSGSRAKVRELEIPYVNVINAFSNEE